MPKVFISHSSLDRELVEREIITPLNTNGIETWYSTDNIRTAEAWERSIREALKSCDWFLVVMSPNSVASKWVQREVHWAIERREGRVIPVMIEACDPEDLHLGLLPIQHIDFGQDIKGAQKKLLAIWGAGRETTPFIKEGTQLKAGAAGQSSKSETTPSKVQGNLTQAQKLYLDYWTAFRDFLQQHNSFLKPQKPQAQNWFPLAIGRTSFALVATIHRKGRRIATNLSLYGPDAKPHFHLLHQDKTAIEREVGESLEWRELASGKESHIRLSKHKTDPANQEDWETQHQWLHEKLELFYRVFAQRIKNLNARDYVGEDEGEDKSQYPNVSKTVNAQFQPTVASPTYRNKAPAISTAKSIDAQTEPTKIPSARLEYTQNSKRLAWIIGIISVLIITASVIAFISTKNSQKETSTSETASPDLASGNTARVATPLSTPIPSPSPKTVQVKLAQASSNADAVDVPDSGSNIIIKTGGLTFSKLTSEDGVVVFDNIPCGGDITITAYNNSASKDATFTQRLECSESTVYLGLIDTSYGNTDLVKREPFHAEYKGELGEWTHRGKVIPYEEVRRRTEGSTNP